MKISVTRSCLKALTPKHPELEDLYNDWGSYEKIIEIAEHALSPMALIDIELWLESHKDDSQEIGTCNRKLKSLRKVMENADSKEISRCSTSSYWFC